MDRPEDFRYAGGYGLVDRSYDTWHVDIRTIDGGLINRAVVLGHRLPEASTKERPQWVQYAFADHDHSQAFCTPVNSRLAGDRHDRRGFVYYDEVGDFRITISREGVYELRNAGGFFLRGEQQGPFWRLVTPSCSLLLDDGGHLVQLDAEHIHLGAGAAQQIVLGNALMAYVNELVGIFNAHLHNPSGNPPITPQPPFTPDLLSSVSKTV